MQDIFSNVVCEFFSNIDAQIRKESSVFGQEPNTYTIRAAVISPAGDCIYG